MERRGRGPRCVRVGGPVGAGVGVGAHRGCLRRWPRPKSVVHARDVALESQPLAARAGRRVVAGDAHAPGCPSGASRRAHAPQRRLRLSRARAVSRGRRSGIDVESLGSEPCDGVAGAERRVCDALGFERSAHDSDAVSGAVRGRRRALRRPTVLATRARCGGRGGPRRPGVRVRCATRPRARSDHRRVARSAPGRACGSRRGGCYRARRRAGRGSRFPSRLGRRGAARRRVAALGAGVCRGRRGATGCGGVRTEFPLRLTSCRGPRRVRGRQRAGRSGPGGRGPARSRCRPAVVGGERAARRGVHRRSGRRRRVGCGFRAPSGGPERHSGPIHCRGVDLGRPAVRRLLEQLRSPVLLSARRPTRRIDREPGSRSPPPGGAGLDPERRRARLGRR